MNTKYRIEPNIKNIMPDSVRVLTQRNYGKGMTTDPHIHDDIEMIYVTVGKFEAYLNGVRYKLSEGDLLVINSREVHTIFSLNKSRSRYVVIRSALDNLEIAGQRSDVNKYMLPFMVNSPTQQKVFSAEQLKDTGVHELVLDALRERRAKRYGFELAMKTDVVKILLTVLRLRGGANDAAQNQYIERGSDISKAFEYINKNYASDLTLDEVAELCSMSYSYFSRTFKAITGQKFSEYLLNVRLREAEYQLATTDAPITEIAYGTGFSSSSYFIVKFREQKGITPKQYRVAMLELRK